MTVAVAWSRPASSSRFRALTTRRTTARSLSTAPCAEGSLAVVFGGFGFTERQLAKHEALYREVGFDVLPVLSRIPQLISPKVGWIRGPELAARIQEADAPVAIHAVSGSFWTMMFTLAHMDPTWRAKNVKAIMFDSCPPKSDVYAFGGWLAWLLQAKAGIPARLSKPLVSQLFHPVRPCFGIDEAWTTQNDAWMFGDIAAGRHARSLPYLAGADSTACRELATDAERRAADAATSEDASVVPRSTHCLFVRGRNDSVLEPQYIDAYYAFLKARTTASVEWHLFEKAQVRRRWSAAILVLPQS